MKKNRQGSEMDNEQRPIRELIFRVVEALPKGETTPCPHCLRPSTNKVIFAQPFKTRNSDSDVCKQFKTPVMFFQSVEESKEAAESAGLRIRTYAYYMREIESDRTSSVSLMSLPLQEGERFEDVAGGFAEAFMAYFASDALRSSWYDLIERAIRAKNYNPYDMKDEWYEVADIYPLFWKLEGLERRQFVTKLKAAMKKRWSKGKAKKKKSNQRGKS